MNTINHFTVNTKNNIIQHEEDIPKELYFYLRGLIEDALSDDGIDLHNNTNFKLTIDEECYMGTLNLKTRNGMIPILTTAGARVEDKRMYVWNEIERIRSLIFPFEKESIIPPGTPFIVDIIYPTISKEKDLELFKWTGDFSRCLAWVLMMPELFK